MKLIFVVLLSVMACAAARAEYPIGSQSAPVVKIHENAADFAVYSGHPRLFFRDTDLGAIRQRIRNEFQGEWEQMVAHVEASALTKPPAGFAKAPYTKDWAVPRSLLFIAVVTGEERYVRWGKEWAAALAAAGPIGNDTEYRGRLQCLAIAYDWLFAYLSSDEKRAIADAIAAHVERSWHFAAGATNYVGGHSRWGNFTLAAGLLALVTERPELREKLLVIRDHWIKGYFPAQGWIAQDGGYHMGWAYSAAYLTASIHHAWSTATNECVYFPWQAKIPWFWIYGRQGDGTYPNTGDAYTVTDDLNAYHPDLLMVSAGIFKDPYALWARRNLPERFADILYGDKRVVALAPGDPERPLPLSRHFRNSGVVIARDRWDEKSTVLQFTSTPFFSTNHLHRDANSFTLHYRGDLAVDSGFYDESGKKKGGYGGTHWRNYFTRTIAHNAITVFDPAQTMTVIGVPAANDGGQVFRQDPAELGDILPGGHAHLDGVTHFEDTPDYTYASGDASKAYDRERVRLAQREIVYLRARERGHPVVVIFDRVESVKAKFRKCFLLHTVNEPEVTGNRLVTENRGGRLTSITLLPEHARLEKVGGAGREAWVDGVNYPWDDTARKRPSRELAMWRLEVSPEEPQERDYFLHVLFVDDAGAGPVAAHDAILSKSDNSATVETAGWRIEFPLATDARARIERVK